MARIGIIGGGFAGLGTAFYLRDLKEHEVTVLEHNDYLGGLASGFKMPEWDWPVDRVIHHWFTSDKWALDIAKEIGMGDKVIKKDTKSSCYYDGRIAELDSPVSVLKFPFLSFKNRLRLGAAMAWLRLDKGYLGYENETSYSYIKRTMGEEIFRVLWEPLFIGKFGKHAPDVNAAWFWARVHPRTKDLAYIEGGFQTYVDRLASFIEEHNGKVVTSAKIKRINKQDGKFEVDLGNKKMEFDYLVMAVPLPVALKLFDFPLEFKQKIEPLKLIGAQYFVFEMNRPFLDDGTYWLNVNDTSFPFMMVAEHTNFVDKKHYNGKHIIWVGKYLDNDNPLWKLTEDQFFERIVPCLKKINPKFERNWIDRKFFTKFENAQPILTVGYSEKIPSIETPIENLYLANMHHIYPWDRGTNNALGLGEKVAGIIKGKLETK